VRGTVRSSPLLNLSPRISHASLRPRSPNPLFGSQNSALRPSQTRSPEFLQLISVLSSLPLSTLSPPGYFPDSNCHFTVHPLLFPRGVLRSPPLHQNLHPNGWCDALLPLLFLPLLCACPLLCFHIMAALLRSLLTLVAHPLLLLPPSFCFPC